MTYRRKPLGLLRRVNAAHLPAFNEECFAIRQHRQTGSALALARYCGDCFGWVGWQQPISVGNNQCIHEMKTAKVFEDNSLGVSVECNCYFDVLPTIIAPALDPI